MGIGGVHWGAGGEWMGAKRIKSEGERGGERQKRGCEVAGREGEKKEREREREREGGGGGRVCLGIGLKENDAYLLVRSDSSQNVCVCVVSLCMQNVRNYCRIS